MNWKKLFPQFEPELLQKIEQVSVERKFNAGDTIMRTGQYIKSTVLILEGRIKIYRENDEGGEFLMYYLGPGLCHLHDLCPAITNQRNNG